MRPAHTLNYHTGMPRFHFDENAPPTPPIPPPAAWHAGTDPEILGHWQNKGLDLSDPGKIAIEMTKQHRAAEKHFGVPVDRLLKLPAADAKPDEIAAFRQRLGAPAKPEEYDFSGIKNAAGEAIPQPLADALRAAAHAKGLTKDDAATAAQTFVKYLDDTASADGTIKAGKLAEERLTLEKNWGGKESATYQFNHLKAIEGARKLGISQEGVKALEGQIGYASTMEAMRKIGAGTSEATFHEGSGSGGPTTREGAAARLAELEGDKGWSKRLTAGDAVATAEWRQLTALAAGEAA